MFNKKSFRISLPDPCHEEWESMTDTAKGKFCVQCNKEVIDFTRMSDAEIFRFLSAHKEKFCGSFDPVQLNRPVYAPPKVYSSRYKKLVAGILAILSFKFSNSQPAVREKAGITVLPVASLPVMKTPHPPDYTIYGKVDIPNDKRFSLAGVVIKAGNDALISFDNLGNYKVQFTSANVKEYTIISFTHPLLNKEVKSIHKTAMPLELNIFLTERVYNVQRVGGAPAISCGK